MLDNTRRSQRAGNVIVFALILMVCMFSMLAFSVDVGYLNVVRTELQRNADAAAIAAAWQLANEDLDNASYNVTTLSDEARTVASRYVGLNPVTHQSISISSGDMTIGYLDDPYDSSATIDTVSPVSLNAVQILVRRDQNLNGQVPLFFAKVLGFDQETRTAQATAILLKNFSGFQIPADGGNLGILPFALDVDTWEDMLAGGGSDSYTWDSDTQTITCGGDGVREVNLFPQGTGSPGNRGTVDIGPSNNSTADIARQILDGISPSDMEAMGGSIELDPDTGTLELNGDTGISAGVKDELAAIKGEPRIIPIFSTVVGPGNNAQYTIVQFAGVRIMNVKLTGKMSSKRVIIQPAKMLMRGAIPSAGPMTTDFIYSPATLVR